MTAAVCPACRHHLRYDPAGTVAPAPDGFSPLRVEGSIRNPADGEVWEYSMVLTIRNERGDEVARRVWRRPASGLSVGLVEPVPGDPA